MSLQSGLQVVKRSRCNELIAPDKIYNQLELIVFLLNHFLFLILLQTIFLKVFRLGSVLKAEVNIFDYVKEIVFIVQMWTFG